MTNKALFYLREYFFPSACGLCGDALFSKEDAFYSLCAACRAFLKSSLAGDKRCKFCGKQLISEKESCLLCREKGAVESGQYNENIARILTFFPYTGKYRSFLGEYKFRKSIGAANFLSEYLLKAIDDLGLVSSGVKPSLKAHLGRNSAAVYEAAWVPVPPRPGKIKNLGWDQIEYLARLLDMEYNSDGKNALPVCRCLKRLPSRSQKELNRDARETNLKGRILCVKEPPETAILFDDVITTGATLNACASALLKGGAKSVYGVCLFYD